MVRDPRAVAARDAEGALELRPARQQRRRLDGQREARGHVAARAAQHQRLGTQPAQRAHHRVVGARLDRAVVDEEQVGDAAQPRHRVVVAVGDRLVGDVAAGHHQRLAHVGQQQVVQRRVGQHHPEVRRARRHRLGHAARRAGAGRSRSAARGPAAVPPPARVSSTSDRAPSRSAAISANGLSSRCLRDTQRGGGRRRAPPGRRGGSRPAPSRPPPAPPSAPRDRDGSRPARPRSAAQRGPHTGHAFGWAWKRRSAGSSYSARHRAHISKPAIVVSGRSYGTPRTIVKRGPQSVQLMNG